VLLGNISRLLKGKPKKLLFSLLEFLSYCDLRQAGLETKADTLRMVGPKADIKESGGTMRILTQVNQIHTCPTPGYIL